MFDKEAIIALQERISINAANEALCQSNLSNELVALPSDYRVHDLEATQTIRRRARGTMATSALAAFSDYTTAHGENGTTVFVDPENMRAVAVLNLGDAAKPGHADNTAKLTLQRTAAYTALLQHASGAGHKQATIAEFLEDWTDNVHCYTDAGDVATPRAIAAIRKITVEAMRKQESSEQQLGASRSAFESVQATSTEPLPTVIYFKCQPYADLNERLFVLRLGVLTGNEKPAITLRIVKQEAHQEAMAMELASLIEQRFDDGNVPVLLGSYSKAS